MKTTRDTRRLVAACCALMFAYGCFLGASQTVIEAVAADLGLDIAGMGALVSLQFLPAAFVPVLMGGVADRIGRKPVLSAFCAVFAAGLMLCGSAKSALVYAIGAIAVGSGYSVCESGCCAVMSDLGPDWTVRGVNLSQAVLCLGAVLSPLVIRALSIGWRLAFWSCAAIYVILLPILLTGRFPAPVAAEDGDHSGLMKLLFSRAILCLFIGILVYVGLEAGFGYFIESLISSRFGQLRISCVSLYWLGMMLSRFVFSSVRYPAKPVLIGGFALSGALFIALSLSTLAGLSMALSFLNGFAFGPVWSTLVAEANARHPDRAGAVSGLMSAGCGAGGILFPALTGLAARSLSLTTAFALLSVLALIGATMCVLVPKKAE